MNQRTHMTKNDRSGFSLLELMIVIGIIGVLVLMFLPATRSLHEATRRTDCANRLRQWALAMHNYHDAHGHFPAVAGDARWLDYTSPETADRLNPFPLLLPFVEQSPLAEEIFEQTDRPDGKVVVPMPNATNYAPWRTRLDLLHCSSARDDSGHPKMGKTDYGFSIGSLVRDIHNPQRLHGAFAPGIRSNLNKDFPDGTSTTLLLAEIGGRDGRSVAGNYAVNVSPNVLDDPTEMLQYVERTGAEKLEFREDVALGPYGRGAFWADAASTNVLFNTVATPNSPSGAIHSNATSDGIFNPSSAHPAGVNTAFVDGSIQFFTKDELDSETWRQFGVPNDSESTENVEH